MSTAEQILVIILSSFLALFLLLAIIATVKVIQILSSLKRIAAKAEHITDNVEHAAELLTTAAGPMAIVRMLTNVYQSVSSKRNKGK